MENPETQQHSIHNKKLVDIHANKQENLSTAKEKIS